MDKISEAIKVFNDGGIVIFPTDTTFVIGCRIDRVDAIKKLFEIRKRPLNQPVLVLVDGIEMTQDYLLSLNNDVIEKLINKFWPGGLTIVSKCKTEKVNELIRAGGETLGVRMPDHKTALSLITNVGAPILGPSANLHGEATPYKFEDLDPELVKLVDYVVPGETKNIGKASTVIDVSTNPWKIIREGAVKV